MSSIVQCQLALTLPAPQTSSTGRKAFSEQLAQIISTHRGMLWPLQGGLGKLRLCVHVRVFFVPLFYCTKVSLVAQCVHKNSIPAAQIRAVICSSKIGHLSGLERHASPGSSRNALCACTHTHTHTYTKTPCLNGEIMWNFMFQKMFKNMQVL